MIGGSPIQAILWVEGARSLGAVRANQRDVARLSVAIPLGQTYSWDIRGLSVPPDRAGLSAADPSNPQSWNRYAYVTNSPLNSTDPLGLQGPPGAGMAQCGPGGSANGCNTPVSYACPLVVTGCGGDNFPSLAGGIFSGWDFAESLEYPIPVNSTTYVYHPPSLVAPPTLYDNQGNTIPYLYTTGGWSSSTNTVGTFSLGIFYPGQNGAFQFAKDAANNFMKKPITNPPGTPGPPGPPPDLGGRDLEAIEAFEKMIHGLMLMMEHGEIQFMMTVMPDAEVCAILNSCNGNIHQF